MEQSKQGCTEEEERMYRCKKEVQIANPSRLNDYQRRNLDWLMKQDKSGIYHHLSSGS